MQIISLHKCTIFKTMEGNLKLIFELFKYHNICIYISVTMILNGHVMVTLCVLLIIMGKRFFIYTHEMSNKMQH
jgi:hypothetical protein